MISEAVLVVLITVIHVAASVMVFCADEKKLKRLEGCVLIDNQCLKCDNLDSDKNGCYCILKDGSSYDDEGRCKNFIEKEVASDDR